MSAAASMVFGTLTIEYDERVLQPRPWTAAQSFWAAELATGAPPGDVLELCTGAGHIGLLAVRDNDRRLVMVDLSTAACDFARRNAQHAGLGDRSEVRQGDLTDAVGADERFAVVIADPPWVPSAEVPSFPEDPTHAIDGGADGLDLVRSCVDVAVRHLLPGGSALLQVGTPDQAEAVRRDLDGRGGPLRVVETRTHERGVLVRLASPSPAT